MTRRTFLQTCALAAASTQVGWAVSRPAATPLVLLSLRGGWDALSALVPLEGPDRALYEKARPVLKVPGRRCRDLGGGRGLHPALEPLRRLPLAVIQAAGLEQDTRSHFVACESMDRGGQSTGWLGRYLQSSAGDFPAVALGAPASSLLGCRALTLDSLDDLNLKLPPGEVQRLESWYRGTDWLSTSGREALRAAREVTRAAARDYSEADYPATELGEGLAEAARILKLDLGVRVLTVEREGWDTHENQAGPLEALFRELTDALLAFAEDLGDRPYTVIVQSEFGRRLAENANGGTDHGRGGLMLVLGKGVRPGLYGPWPGLQEGEDLAVGTDHRHVLAEVLARHDAGAALERVFPGFTPQNLGLYSG